MDLARFTRWLHPAPVPVPPPAVQPQIFHYLRQAPGEKTRVHLRIDPDGSGVVIINSNRILHLNPTAVRMTQHFLQDTPEPVAIRDLTQTYRVPKHQAQADYRKLVRDLQELFDPNGACAFHELDLETIAPFSARPSAPYRMDLALTYRCNNDCAHCYNVSERDDPELSTAEWKQIIDTLWQIGIPHILFTGGEATLRNDLPELIAHAESNGQITGLNTNGRRMSDPKYVQTLVDAGLDHVQITLESHDSAIHDSMMRRKGAWTQTVHGIRNALAANLFVMTNTTMLRENAPTLSQTLDFLAELGVPTVGLNALIYSGRGETVGTGLHESELPALLNLAQEKTQTHGQRLIWYTPTEYCKFDPTQLNLGVKGCTAALYNMCVEPDGGVIPCQSYYRQVGNLRTQNWSEIWEHPLCVALRERHYIQGKCLDCALLPECGGGCPLKLEAQPFNPIQRQMNIQPELILPML